MTCVSRSRSDSRLVRPLRCCRPASVTCVSSRQSLFRFGESADVLQPGVRDVCPVELNDRDVRESRRVFLTKSGDDEIMQPHGFGRHRSNRPPKLLEMLQPRLLPLHTPPEPEADRRQDYEQRDSEQAAR